MKQRIKQYLLIGLAAALLYCLLHYHFIFKGRDVYLLEKTELNLHYTFVSLDNKKPGSLLQIDDLREAGIGDLMVELGMMTENRRYRLESKFDRQY